jgi:hypothetical protein
MNFTYTMVRSAPKGTSQPVTSFTPATGFRATDSFIATSSKPKFASKSKMSKPSKAKYRSKTASAKGALQQGADTENISNRKRCLASIFIVFLASTTMALEYDATDAETIEAAKRASTAPKIHLEPQPPQPHKRKASVIRTIELRPSRWKRFQYGMKLKPKRKAKKEGEWTKFEMKNTQVVKM